MADASAFKESSCLKRMFNTVVEGYKTKTNSVAIEFGVAFHKFREMTRADPSKFGEALLAAKKYFEETPMYVEKKKEYLTSNFLFQTCTSYYTKYSNDRFKTRVHKGHPLLELGFSFPYYIDDEIEILMAGTIDEIGSYSDDGLDCVMDAKSSGLWDVEDFFKGFKLSPQMIFYRWAIRQFAKAFPDSWVSSIDSNNVGCVIDGVFYAGKDAPVQLVRSNVMLFPEHLLTEFEQLLALKVKELIDHVKVWLHSGKKIVPMKYGMLNGACETVYGKCKFFNACSAPDLETEQMLLENNYIKKFYNPLAWRD